MRPTWTAFVPKSVKVVAPVVTMVVAVVSFALGVGRGQGESAEVMRAQGELLTRHTTESAELRARSLSRWSSSNAGCPTPPTSSCC